MKLLVLGALTEELESLKSEMTDKTVLRAGAYDCDAGRIGKAEIILCKCGVGKVNAASAAASILTAITDITAVINTGVAGGIGGGIKRGDVALGLKTVHHDYDQTPDGLRKGQIQGFDSEFFDGDKQLLTAMEQVLIQEKISYKKGVIASGDQFIASKAAATRINGEFGAIACDFESAPIAQVCAIFKVPFLAMRAISDNGEEGAVGSFYEFLTVAAKHNCTAITAFCLKA